MSDRQKKREAAPGPDGPTDALISATYNELRRLARYHLRNERSGHTLQATALVHEVYLRLMPKPALIDRDQFVGIAAHLMRQVLVDYARRHQRAKRGGKDQHRVPIDETTAVIDATDCDRWIALDRALEGLAALNARQAQIVELRYFGGLTVEETAKLLSVSPKTVKRDWSIARAWLRRELAGEPPAATK
jgi:RNA polymerase sigma factor (TIGR02999 family)